MFIAFNQEFPLLSLFLCALSPLSATVSVELLSTSSRPTSRVLAFLEPLRIS